MWLKSIFSQFLTRHMSICIANYNAAVLLSTEVCLITETKSIYLKIETNSCLWVNVDD